MTNDPNELNSKVVWQALGTQGKAYGDTAMEAATKFYEAYPRARKPIFVSEVISYDCLDVDTGKLVRIIKSIHGGSYNGRRYLRFNGITKANYKEKLNPAV